MRFRKTSVLALLLFSFAFGLLKGQTRLSANVETNLSYEDGVYSGVGIGIQIRQIEFIPALLMGEGSGGKLEFRYYPKLPAADRLRPYFALQQVLFRRVDACINNSCPFLFYQFLPGAGTNIRVFKDFHLYGSLSCGVKKRQERSLASDFILGIGGRYEF